MVAYFADFESFLLLICLVFMWLNRLTLLSWVRLQHRTSPRISSSEKSASSETRHSGLLAGLWMLFTRLFITDPRCLMSSISRATLPRRGPREVARSAEVEVLTTATPVNVPIFVETLLWGVTITSRHLQAE